ncbi:hypothetical protein EDB85DRAFT_470596 [Lactarius pseudohatsudake]|nr:hypothetical protein EDB85DRAFT_470596 [Lactarius pseudohatsudake]
MPALIPLDNVLGVFFLGVVLSSILYGVIWLQVYSYFTQHCKGDRLFLKCFVALLLILDTLQLALVVHGFYVSGVTNFGDYLADSRPPWSLKVQTLIGVIVTCSVQHFYAWRIYHLSLGQIYAPAFIVVLSLTELGLGIVYLGQSCYHHGACSLLYKQWGAHSCICNNLLRYAASARLSTPRSKKERLSLSFTALPLSVTSGAQT